jgi:uncharacterized protein (DUF4213/DUF364 family)
MIFETLAVLKKKYGVDLKRIYIEDVRIGVFETFIRLSNNSFGLATTLTGANEHCYRIKRDAGLFSTGYINGNSLDDLFHQVQTSSIVDTLRVAALNALSGAFINENNYTIKANCDPYSLLNLEGKKNVCVVGAFKSYINKLAETEHNWHVIELAQDTLEDRYQEHFVHASNANEVLQHADIIIITGFTLVNNTFMDLQKSIPDNCQVALVGPSSSFIPDVLFEHKVNIVGAIKITDPEKVMQLVGEAASGFHFFKHGCAKKLCLIND